MSVIIGFFLFCIFILWLFGLLRRHLENQWNPPTPKDTHELPPLALDNLKPRKPALLTVPVTQPLQPAISIDPFPITPSLEPTLYIDHFPRTPDGFYRGPSLQELRSAYLDVINDIAQYLEGFPADDPRCHLKWIYELQRTQTTILPTEAIKPDAALLESILADIHAPSTTAVYVGDNLHKDILMANEAHVLSVHAKYGESHRDSRYQLLVDVTHWSPTEVELQRNAKRDGVPDYVFTESFSEMLNVFNFVRFH